MLQYGLACLALASFTIMGADADCSAECRTLPEFRELKTKLQNEQAMTDQLSGEVGDASRRAEVATSEAQAAVADKTNAEKKMQKLQAQYDELQTKYLVQSEDLDRTKSAVK